MVSLKLFFLVILLLLISLSPAHHKSPHVGDFFFVITASNVLMHISMNNLMSSSHWKEHFTRLLIMGRLTPLGTKKIH